MAAWMPQWLVVGLHRAVGRVIREERHQTRGDCARMQHASAPWRSVPWERALRVAVFAGQLLLMEHKRDWQLSLQRSGLAWHLAALRRQPAAA